ncbi:hypothetical protein [Bacillus atrophaeus]|uniref:hypothetical protein n=1 Tax=Bacillus atrophaeus TaxID=1452 RepID=UPI0022813981|nr:hypothetical protein [Bacillus atrophaeus]MCY8856487.1 hypothetical protein [Bacillus atrophaeus]
MNIQNARNVGMIVLLNMGKWQFEKSVKTRKLLRRDKKGYTSWWAIKCRCGWKSETFTE